MGRDGNTRPVPFSMGIPVPLTPMIVLEKKPGVSILYGGVIYPGIGDVYNFLLKNIRYLEAC